MRPRLMSVDALRGLVMIIMALDHVRDFIHRGAMLSQQPTNLATTTPILFMTRWVTHVCAPVFMFTAGMGAFFYLRNERTKAQLAGFLLSRGVWLIFLELTLMQLLYNFSVSSQYPIFLLVLYVLGACMIVLAALIWLPMPLLASLSVATIVLHHLLDGGRSASPWWLLLHQQGAFPLGGRVFIAAYQLVPWFAVMALGYCIASIYEWDTARRRLFLWRAGVMMTIAFLVLRVINGYGDPSRWAWQPTATFTVLSFLNTTKYPPSLMFLLMTLGPALMFLSWTEQRPMSRSNPLIVFGRVPLFYFVLHFFAAHAAIVLLSIVKYGSAAFGFMFQPVPSMGGPRESFPPDFGYDLWVAYAVWIAVVVLLYPVCRWFARVKERDRSGWLSYL